MPRVTDDLIRDFIQRLGYGLDNAVPGVVLAQDLGVGERTIRALAGEAIARGTLVGSVCRGEARGYFIPTSLTEADLGTAHLRSRALSMLQRFHAAQRAAADEFGPEAARLFSLDDLEEVGAT